MSREEFIVRWRGYAVLFHGAPLFGVWSLVNDAGASRFSSQGAAAAMAVEHHLELREVEIETVGPVGVSVAARLKPPGV